MKPRLGFTGSRTGMSALQTVAFLDFVADSPTGFSEFHYGDCVGADEEAFNLLYQLGAGGVFHCHPPIKEAHRAHTEVHADTLGMVVHPASDYLQRDRSIVNSSDVLIGTPASDTRTGGTWYTLDYAIMQNRIPVVIISADGSVLRIEVSHDVHDF
jgi:hypothetical protein